jgi:putative peptidoglycan lipid II flippase
VSDPAVRAHSDAGRLQRAALWMAAGTAVSRVTGLLRIMALAYALGATHLADAYNLANTTPNMLYDIVLGGVLAATFIPVFVDRLATRDEREAWRAISAIVTVSVVVVVAMTIVFWLLAPEVIAAYTAFGHAALSPGKLAEEKAVASTLLRWFVPQVALYGLIALMTALLNTRRRFAAPMWVPIANNVVVIVVLLWFHALVPKFPSLADAQAHHGQLVLLGVGTTLGVLLQMAMLVPSLRGIGLGRLRWRWDPRHEAVRTVLRLGGWTFGFVVANQIALYVVLALAVDAGGKDPVSSYTYAYTFMQMPYAVIAVSVMSAVTPDLAERWATGDTEGFKRRLTGGLRASLAVILPAAMGMLVLARPAVALLLGHGSTSVSSTDATGAALAMFSLGLPGFCTYLYVVRVLQAMQRTEIAFRLYLVENGVNIALAAALLHPLGVRGLALALAVAYTVAAVVGVIVLRRWLGALGGPRAWSPLRRAAGATAVMGVVVLLVSNVSGAQQGVLLLLRVGAAVVAGVAVYAGIGAVLGGRRRALALLTGEPLGTTPTAPTADLDARRAAAARGLASRLTGRSATGARRDGRGAGRGRGAPPGAAPVRPWSATRQPAAESPRIRIVPAPGIPGDLGTGGVPAVPGVSGADMRSLPEELRRLGPIRPVSGRHVRPVGRTRTAGAGPGRAARPGPAPREAPRGRRTPAPGPSDRDERPGGGSPAAVEAPENADDPGPRRWLGGTSTSIGPRRPLP